MVGRRALEVKETRPTSKSYRNIFDLDSSFQYNFCLSPLFHRQFCQLCSIIVIVTPRVSDLYTLWLWVTSFSTFHILTDKNIPIRLREQVTLRLIVMGGWVGGSNTCWYHFLRQKRTPNCLVLGALKLPKSKTCDKERWGYRWVVLGFCAEQCNDSSRQVPPGLSVIVRRLVFLDLQMRRDWIASPGVFE